MNALALALGLLVGGMLVALSSAGGSVPTRASVAAPAHTSDCSTCLIPANRGLHGEAND